MDLKDVLDEAYLEDVLDEMDRRDISCILYQNDVLFQYLRFKLLLIKDILTIKNER